MATYLASSVLSRLEDSLWAVYASGAQPGDENVHLDNLADAYQDLVHGKGKATESCESVVASIEAACQKLEASLPHLVSQEEEEALTRVRHRKDD